MVTGGAGFIGSHVCEALLAKGKEVVCVDNFNDYYDPKIKEHNIRSINEDEKFELLKLDVRDANKLREVFKKTEASQVIHLAAMAGVRNSINDPMLYHQVNVNGTLNLLTLAKEFGIKNFVFGSSSSVYGDSREVPFSEDNVGDPISPYAATKRAGEIYCKYFHKQFRLNIAALRFFTVYGPRNRPDMAVYKFTRAIDKGDVLTMFGDGSSKRDYTYVTDIVGGIMGALEFKGFDIFNLGNSNPVELTKLISVIEDKLNKKAIIKRLPMQEGDVFITCADINKAKNKLGYEPKVSIEEGVSNFVEWYNEN